MVGSTVGESGRGGGAAPSENPSSDHACHQQTLSSLHSPKESMSLETVTPPRWEPARRLCHKDQFKFTANRPQAISDEMRLNQG